MSTLVLKVPNSVNADAPQAIVGAEADFLLSAKPKRYWKFGNISDITKGVKDVMTGKKLVVHTGKPNPAVSPKYITFNGNTFLRPESASEQITTTQSQTFAACVRIPVSAANTFMSIISNQKRFELTSTTQVSAGLKGIYTGSSFTNNNDIMFLSNNLESRVTDVDSNDRANNQWHTFVGVYNYDATLVNNSVSLYIDGALILTRLLDSSVQQSARFPEDSVAALSLIVGADLTAHSDFNTAQHYFIGDIANLAFFDRAITLNEVVAYDSVAKTGL
ncbi:LamG domain-containing protein [Acinetobacter higginsii]|uniref:LamG domain-containing protein n=1 Tax=Acinetobacter higginsii TaxID=70347 RepID=UPI001F4B0154|nr:LamG domain-containing protein [Acinetobacter higginsii]MCH7381189.1 LamG domain-containing protein [Acinetobacter higginsii]